MARKSKQLTVNQREFKKQQNRIKQFVKRAEKRGYIFEDNIVPEMPKRVTKKALEEIKSLKPNKLYGKARAVDFNTGEILTGKELRNLEIKERTKKAQETKRRKLVDKFTALDREEQEPYIPSIGDLVISNFKSIIDKFPDTPKQIINEWLELAVDASSENDVAQVLQDGLASGEITYREFAYDLKRMLGSIARMSDYLKLSSKDRKRIDDAFEEYEDWNDIE